MSAAGPRIPPAVGGLEQAETIPIDRLLARVQELSERKLRFVTASCLDCGDRFELFYHFESGLELTHLKVSAEKGVSVPSISGVYLAAFLVENEMKELFGVEITDIAIDYQGHLLLTEDSAPAPMAKSRSNGSATPDRHGVTDTRGHEDPRVSE